MITYLVTIIVGLILAPGLPPLAISVPLWRRGKHRMAALWHSGLYFALLLALLLVLGHFIDQMDRTEAPFFTLESLSGMLQPVGVLLLLHLLPLIISIPLWRHGRHERAIAVHWILYTLLVLLVTCTPLFGVIHW